MAVPPKEWGEPNVLRRGTQFGYIWVDYRASQGVRVPAFTMACHAETKQGEGELDGYFLRFAASFDAEKTGGLRGFGGTAADVPGSP